MDAAGRPSQVTRSRAREKVRPVRAEPRIPAAGASRARDVRSKPSPIPMTANPRPCLAFNAARSQPRRDFFTSLRKQPKYVGIRTCRCIPGDDGLGRVSRPGQIGARCSSRCRKTSANKPCGMISQMRSAPSSSRRPLCPTTATPAGSGIVRKERKRSFPSDVEDQLTGFLKDMILAVDFVMPGLPCQWLYRAK